MRGEASSDNSIASVMSGVAVRVIVITLTVFICYAVANSCFRFGYTIFCAESAEPAPGNDVEVTVSKGETIDELAGRLYESGVITSEYAFRIQARLYDMGLYPGTYKLNTSMSTRDIVKALSMTELEYNDSIAADSSAEQDADGFVGGGDEGSDTDAAGTADTSAQPAEDGDAG